MKPNTTELSKAELNLGIAELLFSMRTPASKESDDYIKYIVKPSYKRDYTDNWNALMPLVIEHGISLEQFEDGRWRTVFNKEEFWSHFTVMNDNPQRALAECLYKVLLAKENNNG